MKLLRVLLPMLLPLAALGQGQVKQQTPVAPSGANYNYQWLSWANGAFLLNLSIPFGSTPNYNNSLPRDGMLWMKPDSTLWGSISGTWVPVGGGGNIPLYLNALQFIHNGSTPMLAVSLHTDTPKTTPIYYLGFDPATKSLRYDTTQFGRGGGVTLYTGSSTVTSNRVATLNANSLVFTGKNGADSLGVYMQADNGFSALLTNKTANVTTIIGNTYNNGTITMTDSLGGGATLQTLAPDNHTSQVDIYALSPSKLLTSIDIFNRDTTGYKGITFTDQRDSVGARYHDTSSYKYGPLDSLWIPPIGYLQKNLVHFDPNYFAGTGTAGSPITWPATIVAQHDQQYNSTGHPFNMIWNLIGGGQTYAELSPALFGWLVDNYNDSYATRLELDSTYFSMVRTNPINTNTYGLQSHTSNLQIGSFFSPQNNLINWGDATALGRGMEVQFGSDTAFVYRSAGYESTLLLRGTNLADVDMVRTIADSVFTANVYSSANGISGGYPSNHQFILGGSLNQATTITQTSTNHLSFAGFDIVVNGARVGVGAGNISSNTTLGAGSMTGNTTGTNNTATGSSALNANTTGDNNTADGHDALSACVGCTTSVAVGAFSGLANVTGTGNVFLGYSAGSAETGSNKLYIANSSTTTLLKGDFSAETLQIYGTFTSWTPIGTAGTDSVVVKDHTTGFYKAISPTYYGTGSGAVTSVSNSDGTLTISPTTGAVVGSIALGHANTWTAAITVQQNGIATTPTDGIYIQNNTASTSGVPNQYSPNLHFGARVYNTTPTAADNWTDYNMHVVTTSGTSPTSYLSFESSLTTTSTPSYTSRMTLWNGGKVGINMGSTAPTHQVSIVGTVDIFQTSPSGSRWELTPNSTLFSIADGAVGPIVGFSDNGVYLAGTNSQTLATSARIETQGRGTSNATTNFKFKDSGNTSILTGTDDGAFTGIKARTASTATLSGGTVAVTLTGVSTSSLPYVQLIAIGGTVTTTWQYLAVCTTNTLTITAVKTDGTTNTSDTSTLSYLVLN